MATFGDQPGVAWQSGSMGSRAAAACETQLCMPRLLVAGQLRPECRHAADAAAAARPHPASAALHVRAAAAASAATAAAAAVAAAAASCGFWQLDAQRKGCCFCPGSCGAVSTPRQTATTKICCAAGPFL